MNLRITAWHPTRSEIARAHFDLEVDGWLIIRGVTFLRDGTVQAPQLRWPIGDGKLRYAPCIEIPDPDLAGLVKADLLELIRAHVATLPPEKQELPPQKRFQLKPKQTPPPPPPTLPVRPPTKPPLPPPARLLAGMTRGKKRTA